MVFYQRRGSLPDKHFTALREDGELRYEELLSSGGFDGPSSLLYRLHPPTRTLCIEPLPGKVLDRWEPGVVRNHRVDVAQVGAGAEGDELATRTPLFFNDDLVYSISRPTATAEWFYRNGYADEVLVVVAGSGVVETMFGDLVYGPLDVVVVPRGTTWRLRPDAARHELVVLETTGPAGPPARYRNAAGQFVHRSLYSERDLRTPELRPARADDGPFAVVVKTGEELARHVVPGHPFDVVGWDGALYPWALGLADVEPLTGRVHLMPDLHQVLAGPGVVICAVTPARLPDHPELYPAQPDHTADCDELFFRFAADGPQVPGLGSITLHTRAAAHGPKPGFEQARLPERSRVWGIIIDVAKRVRLTAAAGAADDADYVRAWL